MYCCVDLSLFCLPRVVPRAIPASLTFVGLAIPHPFGHLSAFQGDACFEACAFYFKSWFCFRILWSFSNVRLAPKDSIVKSMSLAPPPPQGASEPCPCNRYGPRCGTIRIHSNQSREELTEFEIVISTNAHAPLCLFLPLSSHACSCLPAHPCQSHPSKVDGSFEQDSHASLQLLALQPHWHRAPRVWWSLSSGRPCCPHS